MNENLENKFNKFFHSFWFFNQLKLFEQLLLSPNFFRITFCSASMENKDAFQKDQKKISEMRNAFQNSQLSWNINIHSSWTWDWKSGSEGTKNYRSWFLTQKLLNFWHRNQDLWIEKILFRGHHGGQQINATTSLDTGRHNHGMDTQLSTRLNAWLITPYNT